MKNENDIITDDELEKITGFQVANKQVEKLTEVGVWFVKNRDGKPRTTWYHFNHPLKFRAALLNKSEICDDFLPIRAIVT